MAGLPTLYIYTMQGCEACAEAKPIVEEFRKQHPLKVFAVYVDATRNIVSVADVNVKSTPTYALVSPQFEPLKKYEKGVMSLEQLNDFVFGDLAKDSLKRKRA